ncbi:hypothetical protein KAU34_05925, partial [candidate division WOR-3 bacterium]|nr:hypothetical protein [candidate division WOR-3 bacterium]
PFSKGGIELVSFFKRMDRKKQVRLPASQNDIINKYQNCFSGEYGSIFAMTRSGVIARSPSTGSG